MHTRTLGQALTGSAIGLGCMGVSQSYGPNPGSRDDMVALAWLLAQSPAIVPIPGTRSTRRIHENADATRVGLSADELADLDSLAARVGVQGDRYNEHHMGYVER